MRWAFSWTIGGPSCIALVLAACSQASEGDERKVRDLGPDEVRTFCDWQEEFTADHLRSADGLHARCMAGTFTAGQLVALGKHTDLAQAEAECTSSYERCRERDHGAWDADDRAECVERYGGSRDCSVSVGELKRCLTEMMNGFAASLRGVRCADATSGTMGPPALPASCTPVFEDCPGAFTAEGDE